MSFKDKTYWCIVTFHERYGGEQEGVVGEDKHFEEYYRFFDEVCEYQEAFFVQKRNGPYCSVKVKWSSISLVDAKKTSGRILDYFIFYMISKF